MRLLVLGGTAFVGRHIVSAALDGGHDVTLFNRGQTNAALFPGVERRIGDRQSSDLDSLAVGEWDAVVDVNGYIPRQVREMTGQLSGRVRAYCFVSTGSVYAERGPVDTDEDSRLAELDGPEAEEFTDRTYGPLKVRCERAVLERFPDAALIIRRGLVAGPYDASDRFTYWVRRLARGGRVLGPERPDQPLQLVHARDQADFIVSLLAAGTTGVFNTVGPDNPMTFAEMLSACARVAGTELDVAWAPDQLLREHRVSLPLAVPASAKWDGAYQRSNQRAKEHGFRNRPIDELVSDTLIWDKGRDAGSTMQRMLAAPKEAEVLAGV